MVIGRTTKLQRVKRKEPRPRRIRLIKKSSTNKIEDHSTIHHQDQSVQKVGRNCQKIHRTVLVNVSFRNGKSWKREK